MSTSSSSGPTSGPAGGDPHHHGSHRGLLSAADGSTGVMPGRHDLDAIIVSTARRPAYLFHAADLARALNCTLVTLHSGRWTSAADAARCLPAGVGLLAIDVPPAAQLNLPAWEASRLLTGTVFERRSDLSAKRNLALMLSHMLGWRRIMFLDDDITGLRPAEVRAASGLLDTYPAVGFRIGGFPDHSVVCHAYRKAGGSQQSFIGGGALVVDVGQSNSFFPDIYNDDWFFLLDDTGLRPTACHGRVLQYPYDPFRTPERARNEELGDVLAEGIYWLLDQGRTVADADAAHWARFLVQRRQFIQRVRAMVEKDQRLDSAERARRIAALKGSLGRLELITPDLCERYLRAWAADRRTWEQHVAAHGARRKRFPALVALSSPGCPRLTWRVGTQDDHPAATAPLVTRARFPGGLADLMDEVAAISRQRTTETRARRAAPVRAVSGAASQAAQPGPRA
jgi:hypothetical protein